VSEPAPRKRGELRIYLGAAPGVGKTYAMLGEAHRRLERGTDVVVGFVETHGREKTEKLLTGLEIVPRWTISYRGGEFTEMDLDAVLAREPEVAVVDELAHTNIPGSRNTYRWQDVEDLLAAGIDVLSTVNVQHLESLGDVVEKITGAHQHETVPDEMVRKAEQTELIDLTPEALRRRLAHGNVYPAHRIDAALGNYFRPGNLTALRELALLWVADQVDVALRRYRTEKEITETWETRERVVVAITGGTESETLIRRATRIAGRAGAELLVLHVLRGDGLSGIGPAAIGRLRKLADDIGATFHTVVGDDVPTALLDFARGANATQLVLGTSRRSRWARAFDEGISATVVRRSGSIDVHMVTHSESGRRPVVRRGRSPLSPSRKVIGWTLAVLLPGIATLAGAVWRHELTTTTDVVDYFLALVIVALVGGLGPALFASILSALLLNFFFVPPLYSLTVADPENALTLVVMVVVAVMVAVVVDGAARRAETAARARTEAALVASYARTVLLNPDPLPRLLAKVRENFALSSVALLEQRDGSWTRVASVGEQPCDDPDKADVNVRVTPEVHLALRGRTVPAADRRVLEAAAGQAFLALRQQRLATETETARQQAEKTNLRTALLSAVGHDLRTPLTSIKAAIGSLRAQDLELSEEDTQELLADVEESADRLAGLVDNLLDSSRLAAGVVRAVPRPIGYDEVVARALSGVDCARVSVDVAETLPPVLADPGLLERVVANVVDNALRYGVLAVPRRVDVDGDGVVSATEPAIAIRASEYGDRVELRVVDHGTGLPKGFADVAFEPFTRAADRLGDRDGTNGVGLGLSVAKGFVDAMGGSLRAEDTPGGWSDHRGVTAGGLNPSPRAPVQVKCDRLSDCATWSSAPVITDGRGGPTWSDHGSCPISAENGTNSDTYRHVCVPMAAFTSSCGRLPDVDHWVSLTQCQRPSGPYAVWAVTVTTDYGRTSPHAHHRSGKLRFRRRRVRSRDGNRYRHRRLRCKTGRRTTRRPDKTSCPGGNDSRGYRPPVRRPAVRDVRRRHDRLPAARHRPDPRAARPPLGRRHATGRRQRPLPRPDPRADVHRLRPDQTRPERNRRRPDDRPQQTRGMPTHPRGSA
jgi:two-component system, OmpR family, sensor histidine kinase KdpD